MEVNAQQLYKFQLRNSLSFNKCLFCYLDNESTPFFSIKEKKIAIQETESLLIVLLCHSLSERNLPSYWMAVCTTLLILIFCFIYLSPPQD